MSQLLGGVFTEWNDPMGNQLIALNRNGRITIQGIQYPDGSTQISSLVGSAISSHFGIDVTEHGVVGDGVTDDTAAMSSLITSIGSGIVKFVFPSGCIALLGTISFPTNVLLDFSPGGMVRPITGQTITISGGIASSAQQIFSNATAGLGVINLTSTLIECVFPEWWGAIAGGNASTNTAAIQAAIYGAFGGGATTARTNGSGLSGYNRPLVFSGSYSINDELKWYNVNNFTVVGSGKLKAGIAQGAANKRIVDGQCIAYGVFSNLSFTSTANQTGGLIDLDNDGTHGSDFSPQNITFYDCFISGNGSCDVGVLISKTGGSAQGDNIRAYNCYFSNFSGAAWQIGGDNTGRNAGRQYAQNAIRQQIIGGDIQSCPLYGVASYGGSVDVLGTTMENGFSTQTGFDVYNESVVAGEFCHLENIRSESRKLAASSRCMITNCYLNDQSVAFTPGGSPDVGTILQGSYAGGDGRYYTITVKGVLGGAGTSLTPLLATSGTSTSITLTGAGWTPDAFIGYRASITAGTGNFQYGVITGNTSDTLTVTGWLTNFNQYATATVSPDSTSSFIVEPNWGTQFTSGGATWTGFTESAIDGTTGNGSQALLNNVFIPGLTINIDRGADDGIVGSASNVRMTCLTWSKTPVAMSDLDIRLVSQNNSNGKKRYGTVWYKLGGAVASATTIVPTGNSFHVTGSTDISNMTGTAVTLGTQVKLIFDGILTVQNSGNIKIVSPLTTAVDTVLSLVWDGTNWYGV